MPTLTFFKIKTLLALALLLSMVGCATTASDPLKSPPNASESTIVASVTSNTSQVTAADSIELLRVSKDENGFSQSYTLKQVVKGLARDTSLFIGVIPAGEYEFKQFSSFPQYVTLSAENRALIGRILVKPGQKIDLGRLILTPVNTKVIIGRSNKVKSNLPLLREFAPEHATLFSGEIVSGWETERNANDRIEEYALNRPVGADNPVEDSEGRIIAASRLGTVLIRGKDGRWSGLRSDGLESLIHAIPTNTAAASIVAVGEFKTIVKQVPGSNSLTSVNTGNLPAGNLLFIAGNEVDGWHIIHQQSDLVRVFRSDKLEAGNWLELRREKIATNFWTANSFWFWRASNGIAYAVSDGRIHILNFKTKTWIEKNVPGGNGFTRVTATLGDTISVAGKSAFSPLFHDAFFSNDAGTTWKPVPDVPHQLKPTFNPLQRGKNGEIYLKCVSNGIYYIVASSDEGATWENRSEVSLLSRLHTFPSGAMLIISDGLNGLFDLRYSSDGGKTLSYEYSNFDRNAYEAKKNK